jgi:hypothetical protein
MMGDRCEQADCERPGLGDVTIRVESHVDPVTGEDVPPSTERHRLCRIHLDVVLAAAVIRLDSPEPRPARRLHLRSVK